MQDGRVTFQLEDRRMLDLSPGDPHLRHSPFATALSNADSVRSTLL